MTEVNGREFKLTGLGPFTFSIGDTSSFGQYVKGGIVTEVKKPKVVSFVSMCVCVCVCVWLPCLLCVREVMVGHVHMMT